MSKPISVNYPLVDSTTDRIKSICGSMESNFGELKQVVDRAVEVLQGQTSEAYQTRARSLNSALEQYKSSLDRLNGKAVAARHHIQGVDKSGAGRF